MAKRTFQIYRYDPDQDAKPAMQTIEIEQALGEGLDPGVKIARGPDRIHVGTKPSRLPGSRLPRQKSNHDANYATGTLAGFRDES